MPFQGLDIALICIMLLSGFLALMRGFIREALTLAVWGSSAVSAYLALQSESLLQFTRGYIESDFLARWAGVGVVFLVTVIVLSVISMRLTDRFLGPGINILDRTLGFSFGLARGLFLVAVAYIGFIHLVPPESTPTWVKRAQMLEMIDQTSIHVISILPPDVQKVLLAKTIHGRRESGTDTTGKQDSEELDQSGDSLRDSNREELEQTIENQQTQ